MRSPLRRWDRRSRMATALVVLAGLGCLAMAVRAWHVDVADGPGTPTEWTGLPEAADAAGSGSARDSAAPTAVSAAPFRPEREPPRERYRLPEERDRDGAPPLPEGLRLVGTAVRDGGTRLAAFHLKRRPLVARAGDAIAGLRVIRVEPGAVILAGPDTTLTLRLDVPGKEARDR